MNALVYKDPAKNAAARLILASPPEDREANRRETETLAATSTGAAAKVYKLFLEVMDDLDKADDDDFGLNKGLGTPARKGEFDIGA